MNEEQHLDLFRSLGRIESKLDALHETATKQDERLSSTAKRVNELEGFKNKALGIAVAIGAGSAYIVKAIFSGKFA